MRVSAALSDSSGVAEGGWNLTRQVIIYGESEIKRPIRKIIWVTGEVLKNYNVTFYGILVFIGPAVLHGLWYLAGNVKTSRHGGVGGLDFRSKDAQNNSHSEDCLSEIICVFALQWDCFLRVNRFWDWSKRFASTLLRLTRLCGARAHICKQDP